MRNRSTSPSLTGDLKPTSDSSDENWQQTVGGVIFCPGSKIAITALSEAHVAAVQSGDCQWQFAVEAAELQKQGVSRSVLRALIRAGIIEHRQEVTRVSDGARKFLSLSNLSFPQRTCLSLTDAGLTFARDTIDAPRSDELLATAAGLRMSSSPEQAPHWDPLRRELWFGGHLVKAYRVPAANQERVLAAFQASGWTCCIEDPLPTERDQTLYRQLNRTIQKLNQATRHDLLRFRGDGTGRRICWERNDADQTTPNARQSKRARRPRGRSY